ncbi:MAG: hypothetical protein U0168_08515 [Nannocystaceae bacterium]
MRCTYDGSGSWVWSRSLARWACPRAHAAAGDDENDATDPSRLIARLQKFGEQLQRMGERLGAMQDRLDGADTDVRPTVHPAVVALLTQIDGVRAVAEGLAAVTSPNG